MDHFLLFIIIRVIVIVASNFFIMLFESQNRFILFDGSENHALEVLINHLKIDKKT